MMLGALYLKGQQVTVGYAYKQVVSSAAAPRAGALCQVEAIIGQFYIAVLVARLVSMYGREKKTQESAG